MHEKGWAIYGLGLLLWAELCRSLLRNYTSQKLGSGAEKHTQPRFADCVNGALPVVFIPQVR